MPVIITPAPAAAAVVTTMNASNSVSSAQCSGDHCIVIYLLMSPLIWLVCYLLIVCCESWQFKLFWSIVTAPISMLFFIPFSLALNYLGFPYPLQFVEFFINGIQ